MRADAEVVQSPVPDEALRDFAAMLRRVVAA